MRRKEKDAHSARPGEVSALPHLAAEQLHINTLYVLRRDLQKHSRPKALRYNQSGNIMSPLRVIKGTIICTIRIKSGVEITVYKVVQILLLPLPHSHTHRFPTDCGFQRINQLSCSFGQVAIVCLHLMKPLHVIGIATF